MVRLALRSPVPCSLCDVRRANGLTVDRAEACALESTLSSCESTALEPIVCAATGSGTGTPPASLAGNDALAR